MSAGHLFSALTGGGVYFDKKKYAGDLALFRNGAASTGGEASTQRDKGKKRAAGTASTTAAGSSNGASVALPAELDFFGSNPASSAEPSTRDKKRKRDATDEGPSTGEAAASSPTAPSESASTKDKPSKTHQRVLFVGAEEGKLHALRQLVLDGEMKPPVLLFVQSVQRAQDLFSELAYDNLRVDVVHQDRAPSHRRSVVDKFKQGQVWVLIATDKMAKMIPPHSCNLVISYDFPQSAQAYTDRIARTGRPGKEGKAVTFFTKDDRPYLKIVVNVMKVSGSSDIPPWLLALPNLSKNEKRKLKRKAPERKDVKDAAGTSTFGRREAVKRAEMVAGSKRRSEKGIQRQPKKRRSAQPAAEEEEAAGVEGPDVDDDDEDDDV